jgi:phage recombination protein Bet
MSTAVAQVTNQPASLISKMASRFAVEPNKLLGTLKATAFKGEVSNEQMMALLIVADQYKLNPFTKELYAFPDKNNGIVPVVGVDGWARIINENAAYDGIEFIEPEASSEVPAWIECVIHRKDRAHPTRVREYMSECKRDVGPWRSHPRRMLRHKSMIQCARLAFGFVGIYDEDEAQRIVERDITPVAETASPIAAINAAVASNEPDGLSYAEVADMINAAKNTDELDLAASHLAGLHDKQQRVELSDLINARRIALG